MRRKDSVVPLKLHFRVTLTLNAGNVTDYLISPVRLVSYLRSSLLSVCTVHRLSESYKELLLSVNAFKIWNYINKLNLYCQVLLTFFILNSDLKKGARIFGLLITTTFIQSPLISYSRRFRGLLPLSQEFSLSRHSEDTARERSRLQRQSKGNSSFHP